MILSIPPDSEQSFATNQTESKMNSTWEAEIDKIIFAYNEDRENLKVFIRSLLKQQRDEYNKTIKTVLGVDIELSEEK